MWTSSRTPPEDSSFLLNLRNQLERFPQNAPPQTLVLTCDDPRLDSVVIPALCGDDSLLLRIPGPRFDTALRHDLWDAILHAVDNIGVSHLVVCGHSESRGEDDSRPTMSQIGSRLAANGDRLLGGVMAGRRKLQLAQRQTARQLDWLLHRDEIALRIAHDGLAVLGLFYLFESGVFLIYDHETRKFAAASVERSFC